MAKQEEKKPEAQAQPQPQKALTTWQGFEAELAAREREFSMLLPDHISRDKFRICAISAVQQNPTLLTATLRSLFSAIKKAAQDGLLPDGREGFINVYSTEVKLPGGRKEWQKLAQWMPMAAGLRKRAKELDGILIDAQVVYKNDHFVWHQGDEPRIEHTPTTLGDERGAMCGAYAIFKREGGLILHREVMDFGQIEKARSKSSAPNSMMWKDFTEEGYRKTVLRRGFKTIPVSEKLHAIVSRDDELFDFSHDANARQLPDGVVEPRAPRRSDFTRGTDRTTGELKQVGHSVPIEIDDPREEGEVIERGQQGDNRQQLAQEQGDTRDHGEQEEEETAPVKAAEHPKVTEAKAAIPENETPFQRGMRLLMGLTTAAEIDDLKVAMTEELKVKPKQLKVWEGVCEARKAELK